MGLGLGLNGKGEDEEAFSSCTEASLNDRDHSIDIPGSLDATTSDGITADCRSQQAPVEEARALVREANHDTIRPQNHLVIQGKSLEQLKEEEGVTSLEIKHLENRLWIKQNTVYNEVLQDAERIYKLMQERLERYEKRIEELTNQVFNVVSYFSVCQGVIFTSVTQLSSSVTTQLGAPQARPLCGKVWLPVVLSALAAFGTIVSVVLKFKDLYTVGKDINLVRHSQKAAQKKIDMLQRKGPDFKFHDIIATKFKTTTTYWVVKCFVVIGALIAITVLLSLSYFVNLCDKFVVPGWN